MDNTLIGAVIDVRSLGGVAVIDGHVPGGRLPAGESLGTSSKDSPSPIDHPPHYQGAGGIEAIDVIEAMAGTAGHLPTAVKYILRHRAKGRPAEDLRKAAWYVRRALACPILPTPGARLPPDKLDRVADAFGLVGLAREALGHVALGIAAIAGDADGLRPEHGGEMRRRLTLTEAVAALDLAAEAVEAGG